MALVLKKNKTYIHKGIDVQTPYAVIDKPGLNKNSKRASIQVDIYASSDVARKAAPLETINVLCVTTIDFDTMFSSTGLANKDPYKAAYEYILTCEDFSDWESDE